MALDYHYDETIRRYLLQFVRIFNQFQYRTGKDAHGNSTFRVVPATLATMDRQVNSIMQNNSENVLLSTPQISCWISALRRNPERIQDPNYVRSINTYERAIDPDTGKYTSDLGRIYNIETYMPVPYDLIMQTDIWTSNEYQKQQLLEQILILFNPSLDLQTGMNPIDWTSLTIVELQDITWSSRTYPAGTTDQIDVASLTFRIPIWLSAPSKVKRQSLIEQIVIDIGQIESMNVENGLGTYWTDNDLISRLIITPGDFHVNVSGNDITLLNPHGSVKDATGNPMTWITLLQKYGKFRNNISQIRLKPSGSDLDDSSHDVIGVLALNPNDTDKLFWTVDMATLQANTMPAVTRIINPIQTYPGKGLDAPEVGQRYLLLHDVPSGVAWGGIIAHEQDIIEYTSDGWIITFEAIEHQDSEYVVNDRTGTQYHWNGSIWHASIDGEYPPGYWRLAL